MCNKKFNYYTTDVYVSTSECLNLCEVLANYIHMIENKRTDKASMQDKHNSWDLVMQEYNYTSPHKMTVDTLRQCYRALKCKARNTLSESKTNILDLGEFPESEYELFEKVCTLMMGPTVIQSHASDETDFDLLFEDFEMTNKIKKECREETAEAKALVREKIELCKLKKKLIQTQIQVEEEKLLRAQLERAEQEEKTLFSHKICSLKLM